jgi:hypothetical protein
VGQAGAMIIAHVAGKNLHLAAESAERGRVDNAIPIPLKRPAIWMFDLGVLAAAGIGAVHRIASEQEPLAVDNGLQLSGVTHGRYFNGPPGSSRLSAQTFQAAQSLRPIQFEVP